MDNNMNESLNELAESMCEKFVGNKVVYDACVMGKFDEQAKELVDSLVDNNFAVNILASKTLGPLARRISKSCIQNELKEREPEIVTAVAEAIGDVVNEKVSMGYTLDDALTDAILSDEVSKLLDEKLKDLLKESADVCKI